MAQTPEQRLRKKRLYSAYRYQKNKSDVLKKQKEAYAKNPEKYRIKSNKSYAKCTGKEYKPLANANDDKLSYNDIAKNGMHVNVYNQLVKLKTDKKNI